VPTCYRRPCYIMPCLPLAVSRAHNTLRQGRPTHTAFGLPIYTKCIFLSRQASASLATPMFDPTEAKIILGDQSWLFLSKINVLSSKSVLPVLAPLPRLATKFSHRFPLCQASPSINSRSRPATSPHQSTHAPAPPHLPINYSAYPFALPTVPPLYTLPQT
jgi:hypothetical protein